MLIEPLDFYGNPETMETNVYQVDKMETHEAIQSRALAEFRAFRNLLTENGVFVTVARGHKNCPDQLFPNWISTHENNSMILYPMLNESRRRERAPEMVNLLTNTYDITHDLRDWENEGLFLEATGSLCLDRINRIVYAGLSARTSANAVKKWADLMGYEPVIFETRSHTGAPVYHSDLVLYIGTEVAGVCLDCMLEEYRKPVMQKLSKTHDIVELTFEQQKSFSGNSLEILGDNDERLLAMSSRAYNALSETQKEKFSDYFAKLIHTPLTTIETYGGGSARCLMLELF